MTALIKFILTLLIGTYAAAAVAQSFNATVHDARTNEPIPFATVKLSKNTGTITNEEGIFTIGERKLASLKDSVYISSMGYEEVAILPKKVGDTIIKLKVKTNELDNVFLTNNPLEVEDIIARVKENIATNYPNTLTEKKIFFRQSASNTMDKMDVEVEKTTIPEFNQAFMDSLVGAVEKKSDYYSESVGTLAGNYNKQKLVIDKAAKLYDKSKKDVGVESFGKRLEEIVEKNVKADSYFKIKSGIIGTTIEVDDSTKMGSSNGGLKIEVDTEQEENDKEQAITASIKSDLSDLFEAMFYKEDTKLDFLTKSNRYRFTKREFTSIGDAIVYVIDFEPKGRKDFKGTLYINTEDYAVMRLEYENVRKLSSFGMFGISYKKYLYRGKSIYAKDENGGYSLRYMELEDGEKVGIDRPLKIIEKNKNVAGRRKQNEVAMEIEFATTSYSKKELVVFNSVVIDEPAYKNVTESEELEATYLPNYNPNFWKGYTIMEPNAAIQSFKSESK